MTDLPNQDSHRHLNTHQRLQTAELSQSAKSKLENFLQKFPTIAIAGADDEFLLRLESQIGKVLPAWLRNALECLCAIAPGQTVWIKLSQFQYFSPRAEQLDQIWYQFGIGVPVSSEFHQLTIDQKQGLLTVGSWLETLESILVIRLDDPKDQKIYEFSYENIDQSGNISSSDLIPVIGSYSDLFPRITAIKIRRHDGEHIIYADDIQM